MNILFYTILFIIGIVVGSYWSIKADEIPKNMDMKRTHSSSKPWEEKRSILSYTVIGGVSSVILANILKLHVHEFDILNLTIYIFAMLYISTLVLIGGIDKNYIKIVKKLIAFGIVSSIVYMLYLCIVDLASVHLNALYMAIYMLLLIIDSFLLRRYAKDSYILNILLLINIILVFTDLKTLAYTLSMAFVAILLYVLLMKSQEKKNGNKKLKINQIPVGYFISASNVIVLLMIRVLENYMI